MCSEKANNSYPSASTYVSAFRDIPTTYSLLLVSHIRMVAGKETINDSDNHKNSFKLYTTMALVVAR